MTLKTIRPGEEPYVAYLRETGRTLEEQGPGNFLGFFAVDYFAYQGMVNALGADKAEDIYKKLWQTFPPQWVDEAKLNLEIGRLKALSELADIIIFCEKKKFVPFKVVQKNNKGFTLESKMCPFTEIATKFFGIKRDHSYFKAVYKMEQDFLKNVLNETKMGNRVKLSLKKAICKGIDVSQIVCEKKGKAR